MKIRLLTPPFQLYLGCRWCPLFAIVFEILAFDTNNKFDCQVALCLVICGWSLSCYIGLGRRGLRKMLHSLYNVILTVSHHPDIWISLICVLISTDHSAHVSKT
jgi:hypothetical protein